MFLLSGCVQALYRTPDPQDEHHAQFEKSTPAPIMMESSAKVKSTNERPLKSDSAPTANTIDGASRNRPKTFANNPKESSGQIKKNQPIKEDSGKIKKNQPILDEALDFCRVSQDFWQKGEIENALEALDQAYSLILKIDTLDDPELIQQKEDLRFLISKRILEIYASRNIVVSGNHNAIPMVMNQHIQAEIDLLTKNSEKNFFVESLKRSGRYRPMIVSALEKAGLPVELSWLPLIESGFKVEALSKARALGLWQFIPSTGYKFGLSRDKYIDERIDPIKATQAAIAYLKELHQLFGDWTTVLAAYNCGEGQVLRVIRSQNINYLDNFWDLYERLPLETARYVPRFMATLHIVKNLEQYGLDAIRIDPPWDYEVVPISKQVHLRDIAATIGLTEKDLQELNPELRYRILPQDKYPLKVPPGTGNIFLAKLDEIPVAYPPQSDYIYHQVRPGETLSTVAAKYRTSVQSIARGNNIRKQDSIAAGQILKLPRKGTTVSVAEKRDKPRYEQPKIHVVKSGDSLWNIAKRYGATTKDIQELNNLASTNLSIGQALKIPGGKDEIRAGETLVTYKVKRGDSAFQIAQRHKMSLEQFLRINQLTPRSQIYPGQKLYVE